MTHKSVSKVLIVLYYWPPAGGPGVQRWLKFVKYLKAMGVQPTVYAPRSPHYPTLDKSLEMEIPNGVEIIKAPISEPYGFANLFSKSDTKTLSKGIIKTKSRQNALQRLMLFVRGNLFIPDARMLWIKPSVKRLRKLIQDNNYDAIITTGPPHSLHRIGYKLKQKFSHIKWIADFRDPWTNIGYHHQLKLTEKSQQKHLQQEKEVLDCADHIIVTSPSTQAEFESKTTTPVSLITNGFDDIDFHTALDEHFTLSHIGTLLNERNPENLWQVISELIEESEHFKTHIELKFVGQVGQNIVDSIERYGLKKHSNFLGYLPHKDAQEHMHSAQVLLLIEKNFKQTRGIIPGKFFEYLQSKRPVLGIGPQGWDVAGLIKDHQAGSAFNYEDKTELKSFITSCFNDFMKGKLKVDSRNIEKYHRKYLTEKLVEVIEKEI
jgi:glycosyltransferase involved in cell wall biosynthesis